MTILPSVAEDKYTERSMVSFFSHMGIAVTILRFVLFVALIFSWTMSSSAQEPSVSPSTTVTPPPGQPIEEDFDTTLFDLYLADQLKGGVLVNFTDEWFEIRNPAEVLEQLPSMKATREIPKLFTGRIYYKKEKVGVGSIEFDVHTFRALVNIDPEYLHPEDLSLDDLIPDPENKFSLQQTLGTAVSGEISENYIGSFNHQTLVSAGKYWAKGDGTYAKDNDYELTNLSFNGIIANSYEVNVGLLQTNGQFFSRSEEFAGMNVQTSEEVFLNPTLLRGSRLEVFVPFRSRVEFFRGNRLLSVQFLNFGLQEVNTAAFPQGSYEVEIVINGDDGRIIKERRFFVKSGLLALRSKPIYTFQLGVARDQTDLTDIPIYQIGARWRATDILQLESSAYGIDDFAVGSIEALGLYQDLIFGAGFLYSSDGDTAVQGRLDGVWGIFQWNFTASHAIGGFDDIEETTLSTNEILLLSTTQSDMSGNFAAVLGDLKIRYSMSRTEGRNGEMRFAYGPRLEWYLKRKTNWSLRLDTAYLNTSEGNDTNIFLTYTHRFGRWTGDFGLRHQSLGKADEDLLLTSLSYDSFGAARKGTRLRLEDELQHRDNNGNVTNTVTNRFEIEHKNNLLKAGGFINDQRRSGFGNTTLGVNVASAFRMTQDGAVSFGSPGEKEVVLIAEIESSSTTSKVEILVNGQIRDIITGGGTGIIGLSPFRTYEVSIRPSEEADLVSYDTTKQRFTAFPGNIIKKSWKVERVIIVLGRLIDIAGNPITWQRIKGPKEYTITEADGSFQAEITPDSELVLDDQYRCVVNLPDTDKVEFIIDVGDVVCK